MKSFMGEPRKCRGFDSFCRDSEFFGVRYPAPRKLRTQGFYDCPVERAAAADEQFTALRRICLQRSRDR